MPRTHYDNLKVARNAPAEVIKAAYRALSQKYHPDVNKSPDAHRIMLILNDAWSVLGDPQRRARYDARLAELEDELINEAIREAAAPPTQRPAASPPPRPSAPPPPPPPPPRGADASPPRTDYVYVPPKKQKFELDGSVVSLMVFAALGVLIVVSNIRTSSSTPVAEASSAPPPVAAATVPETVVAQPYSTAPAPPLAQASWQKWSPTGKPWPTRAQYFPGLKVQARGGLSTLTIDNSSGSGDVHVKLCNALPGRCDGLRQLFLPDGNRFTMESIRSGTYEIRYRDLQTGQLSKTPPFELLERETEGGREYSTVTMTLYKVHNGNMQVREIGEEEF